MVSHVPPELYWNHDSWNKKSAADVPLEERVRKGMEMLDATMPGWVNKINEADLDMSECSNCVLGQVFGEYRDGVVALGLFDVTYMYGFEISIHEYYWELQDEVLRQIKSRLT